MIEKHNPKLIQMTKHQLIDLTDVEEDDKDLCADLLEQLILLGCKVTDITF